MGICRGADDTMHILVDGEDMGPAATGVAKVDPGASLGSGSGIGLSHLPLPPASHAIPERVGHIGSLWASADCIDCQLHKARGAGRHPAAIPQLGHRQ